MKPALQNLIFFFILFVLTTFSSIAQNSKPNIILIMADDLGYSDLGCYGGEINTPNLNYLAKNGLRFSKFYNISRCCPTRAALLTGVYNQQAGIGNMTTDQHALAYRGRLNENSVTLAEVLKTAGYQTGMVGKWHVSNTIEQNTPEEQLRWLNHQSEHEAFSPVEQYPVNRGFDKFYGTLWGVIDYFDPFSLVNGTKPVMSVPKNYYHTDAINDTAVAYIKSFAKKDMPFFIYVAHNAPHWPVQALPEDIARYENTYKKGWEAIRQARYKKMVSLGLIDPKTQPLPPMENGKHNWANNPDKKYDARAMAVHAAMIDRMDQGIGRIIKELKTTGEMNNTLILFLSDNGASPEIAANFGPGFDRPGETRDGRKIIYPKDKKTLPGPETVYSSIGPEWANTVNTPFRYWKRESFEGGVRTPMIAFWPEGILKKNSINKEFTGHVMDFMATFIQLSGAVYPKNIQGKNVPPMQGISFLPALKGQPSAGHHLIFNEHVSGRSVHQDNWKLVKLRPNDPWQLYNLQTDGTEQFDLAAKNPNKVKQLSLLWDTWAAENQVLPKPAK